MELYKRLRPTSLDGILGQAKAVAKAKGLISSGLGGRALWIDGESGTGKTTLAFILAREIADDFSVDEIDAGTLTGAGVRDLEAKMSLYGMGEKSGRAYIVNEAHGLRRDAIRQFLVTLERLPKHCLVIFTTTKAGTEKLWDDDPDGDASPLLSRCARITLTNQGLADPFAAYLVDVAKTLGKMLELKRAKRIVQDCKNNLRMALSELETLDAMA